MDEEEFIHRLERFWATHENNYFGHYRDFRTELNNWRAGGPNAPQTVNVATRLFDTLTWWRMDRRKAPFSGVADNDRPNAIAGLTQALAQHQQTLQQINDGPSAYADPQDFAELGAAVVQALFGVLANNAVGATTVRFTFPSQAMMLLTGRCISLSRPVREGLRHVDDNLRLAANRLYNRSLPLHDAQTLQEHMGNLLSFSQQVIAAMPVPPVNRLPRGWRGVEPARLCDCVLHDLGRNGP